MAGLFTELRKKARVRTRLQSLGDDVREKLRALRDSSMLEESRRRLEQAWVDPRIVYPSYKSLDNFIDLDRLKRLDGYLRERLERRTADGKFWTGPYTLKVLGDRLPGSKMIELTRNTKGGPPTTSISTSKGSGSLRSMPKNSPRCWRSRAACRSSPPAGSSSCTISAAARSPRIGITTRSSSPTSSSGSGRTS